MMIASDVMRPRKVRFRLILFYLVLISPFLLRGVRGQLEDATNSPVDWVDSSFAARAEYDRFTQEFGAGDQLVISWDGCTITNSALDMFVKGLRESNQFYQADQWYFEDVTSGREVVSQLVESASTLSWEDAAQRLRGSLVGDDLQTTCVIIRYSRLGLDHRSTVVPLVRAAATHYCQVKNEDLHLVGPIMDGYAVDAASRRTMRHLAPISTLVVLVICVLSFDSLLAALLVFLTSLLCQAIALAMLYYCDVQMTALLIVLPPLIQVLAVAGGVHWMNYYLEAVQRQESDPVAEAMRGAWLPTLSSLSTTAVGIGSLGLSGLLAVQQFGVYAAFAVIVTLVALLSLLPGALSEFPLRVVTHAKRAAWDRVWIGLLRFQQRYSFLVIVVALAMMAALGWGVSRLEASVRIETLFEPDSSLIRDYAWLEDNVGPMVPIDVVIEFDETASWSVTDRMNWVSVAAGAVDRVHAVSSVVSYEEFLPPAAEVTAIPEPLRDQAVMDAIRQSLLDRGLLAVDGNGREAWRLTAYVSAFGELQYAEVLDEMRAEIGLEFVAEGQSSTVPSVRLTGLMPLVHEIQAQLLEDLFSSFLCAFALIAVAMTIVQAGLWSGLLSMIPNVFPTLVLFGGMGWWQYPLDIGSIMTASVALGIAVDDTLHFLSFTTAQIHQGKSRSEAVLEAYRHCGRAMLQTTAICGLGMVIFCFSDFIPTARFAWMMLAMLTAALFGDLLILPAIILSPLGRFYSGPRSRGTISAGSLGPKE